MAGRVAAVGAKVTTCRLGDEVFGEAVTGAFAEYLVVPAKLIAPKPTNLSFEDMVREMKRGSVIVDVAVDQGGCIETTHETTHADPTYVLHDVIHYAVGNVPASVPRTSTYALTNATLPYVVELASKGVQGAVESDAALAHGVNTVEGHVTNAAVAEALGVEAVDPREVLVTRSGD